MIRKSRKTLESIADWLIKLRLAGHIFHEVVDHVLPNLGIEILIPIVTKTEGWHLSWFIAFLDESCPRYPFHNILHEASQKHTNRGLL